MRCRSRFGFALLATAAFITNLPSIYAQTTYDVIPLPKR